jgi:hypothetical protein
MIDLERECGCEEEQSPSGRRIEAFIRNCVVEMSKNTLLEITETDGFKSREESAI